MEDLKRKSICVSGRVAVCWPQHGDKEETLDMTDIGSKFNGCYATNNSTICYVIDHEVFVTPYTRKAIITIRDAGLVEKHFFVPFSNWDYPRYEKDKWRCLQELAIESYYHDYEEDSNEWCSEHNIGELSEETMKRCFRIPREGVPVKHLNYEDAYYPLCNEYYMDDAVIKKLGCYCTNNGRVVFVYRDGHTYVTRGYWVLDELRHAGYKESGLFVPFSNGEQITDPYLASKWEKISQK